MKSPVILRVFKDQQLLEVRQFDQNQIVLGQDAEVHLDLKGDGVSAIHCLIELRDGGYYVCDLGSQTGTFKNGQAVLDSPLSSGDEIAIGPFKVVFFFGVPKPGSTNPGITKVPLSTPAAPEPPPRRVDMEKTEMIPPPLPNQVEATQIPSTKPGELAEAPPKATPKAPAKSASKATKTSGKKGGPVVPSLPKEEPLTFQKPEIRGRHTGLVAVKKGRKTFAPASEVTDLKEYLKPGKGPVVEVIVAWKERVLTTYHFKNRGVIRAGAADGYEINLPEGALPKGWPLLDIGGGVKVAVGHDLGFELISAQGSKSLEEVMRLGKATKGSAGTSVRLEQNEMICLSLMGGTLQVFIRYAPQAPVVPLIPAMLLSGPELTAVLMALVMAGLLAFYITVTTPPEDLAKTDEDVLRTAQIIFNTTPHEAVKPPPPEPPVPVPPPPPPPEKAKLGEKQQETQKTGHQSPTNKSSKNAVAGRAAEVAPIPNSQNRPKKFTSIKQGGAIKLGEKAGANAQSKDISRAGLFSAFGPGGSRAKLDPSYSGAGGVLGQADKATGTSGMDSNRTGDDLGSKVKDTGAGGKGTATEGISGIGTKGRSTGQGQYGSADGFGDKTSVAVEPGDSEADFIGSIDKEAVRRVIRHYQYEIRGCYQKELNRLEKGQHLEGKIVMTWEIIEKGRAKNVRVRSSTLNNKNIENCLRERIASYEYPNPPAGMTAEVTAFPFYFRPATK